MNPELPPDGATPHDPDSPEAQHARLHEIEALEAEIEGLRAEETRLEVERIEARVLLKADAARAPAGLDPERAGVLAEALDRVRAQRAALGVAADAPLEGAGDSADLVPLRAARAALADWLDAPRKTVSPKVKRVADVILGLATIGAVWAAIALHPVFLLLLVPVATFVRFVGLSGQDTAWLRLGAQRHFTASGLAPPSAWSEDAVRRRAAELDAEIAAREQAPAPAAGTAAGEQDEAASGDEARSAGAALLEAEAALELALARAGLEPGQIDGAAQAWLDHVLVQRRADRRLAHIAARRKRLGAEAEDLRWRVFRFLSDHGQAPPDGRADRAALAAGLARVAAGEESGPGE